MSKNKAEEKLTSSGINRIRTIVFFCLTFIFFVRGEKVDRVLFSPFFLQLIIKPFRGSGLNFTVLGLQSPRSNSRTLSSSSSSSSSCRQINEVKCLSQEHSFRLFFSRLAPQSSTSNTLLTSSLPDHGPSVIKSTNFSGSIGNARAEYRHKSEIEIEVKHEQNRTSKSPPHANVSPLSTSSYPALVRSNGGMHSKRTPIVLHDEPTHPHPIAKRRIFTNTISTQTPPSQQIHPYDQQFQQQQLKALTDEALSKNEKIQAILRELNDCQVSSDHSIVLHHFLIVISHPVHHQTAGPTIIDE